jgi:hypothetical protein
MKFAMQFTGKECIWSTGLLTKDRKKKAQEEEEEESQESEATSEEEKLPSKRRRSLEKEVSQLSVIVPVRMGLHHNASLSIYFFLLPSHARRWRMLPRKKKSPRYSFSSPYLASCIVMDLLSK